MASWSHCRRDLHHMPMGLTCSGGELPPCMSFLPATHFQGEALSRSGGMASWALPFQRSGITVPRAHHQQLGGLLLIGSNHAAADVDPLRPLGARSAEVTVHHQRMGAMPARTIRAAGNVAQIVVA